MSVRRVFSGALLLVVVSCGQKYVQPLPDQPQAVLKFRRAYSSVAGARLSEELDLDGARAFDFEGDSSDGEEVRTDAITVFTGFHSVEVKTQFSAVVSSGGTTTAYDHGTCEGTVSVNAQDGATYLIQVNYESNDFCTVECYQQVDKGKGEFSMVRCR